MKSLSTILEHKDFILTLAKRDIIAKYKQSLLGILWIILQPLGLMVVLTVVFSLFVRLPSEGLPYAPFLFVALLPYMYINSTVNTSTKLINSYAGLIRQRNFFRPSLVFIKFLSETVNFGFALIGLVIVLLFYKIVPGFYALYAIPILAIQMILMLGIMFFLSATNVYVRDIGMIVPLGVRMLRYLSPIMYSYHSLPLQYQPYLALNPLTGIFDGYRQTILHNQPPDMTLLLYSLIFSLFIFFVGWFTFMKLEKNFADVV
ncbi:ABC transporter permease [Alkalihalobacillus sp. MEB130]|uniref:ABC transporter permease n=1 Tax=Alkalihalobacillus sp. MEB130 TaxID=2976704 RepID=UPI0028DD6C13|nr:ABC transporter permease [Alkalihalobacillus sp. MEB130]MDT8860324.1 ABC transporter permease [Alkalihalobacillus sp. MEB130]